MLQDQIPIDRDGQRNQQLIESIRTQVQRDCDGRLPFLLLPVRIETRFMRVDRPVTDNSNRASLLELLGLLKKNFVEINTRKLATGLGSDNRKLIKQTETEHYRFLDQRLDAAEKVHAELSYCLRNCSGSKPEDATVFKRFAAELRNEISRTSATIQTLRSDYQKASYQARLDALDRDVLTPVDQQLATAARKLELTTSLQFIDIGKVHKQITRLRADVDKVNSSRLADYDALQRARKKLYPQLQELRRMAHAVIRGDRKQLDKMHTEWQQLDQVLAKLQLTIEAVPVDNGRQEAGRSRTVTHIEKEYRRDLRALGGGSLRQFQLLSNKDFNASADGAFAVTRLLEQQQALLQAEPAAPSRRAAQLLTLAKQMLQQTRRLLAFSRDIAIIPSARYKQMTKLHTAVASSWSQWETLLVELTGSSGRDASNATSLLKQLTPALSQQGRALYSQRTDVWDAYDRFYDDIRYKVFAVDTRRMETVDELWVRVYPDDISIHTHEEGMTEEELRDGHAFWIETHAAENDDELKRGAWRALVRLHGSRRAAWIAKQLKPTVTRPFEAGQRLVGALQALERRIKQIESRAGTLLRNPLKQIARIQKAADVALQALERTNKITARQRSLLEQHMRVILDGLKAISSRFDRRGPFLSDQTKIRLALERLATSLQNLQTGINKLPVDELSDDVRNSLHFPDVDSRAADWTVAPHCKTMPDRFIALAVRDDKVVHAVAGNRVDDITVGLDPNPDHDDASQFQLDDEGRLLVGDSIRWMTDFDEAVARGMGITIGISTADVTNGFDELFVLGVRDKSADETRALVEQLLNNHHYNEDGLGFLPLGTPTNNTEQQSAAWSSNDDPEASYEIERSEPLFNPNEQDPNAKSDGLRFAEALGISASLLTHVAQADTVEMSEAAIMNRALWPATIGTYIEEFLSQLVSTRTLKLLEDYFVENVSARGKLPSLRVGSQPYGIITTSAISRFESALGNTLPALPAGGISDLSDADHARRFEILLHELITLVAADWSEIRRNKVAHAHSESVDDAQQHFMDMLGLHATSVSADYRFALNVGGRHPAQGSSDNLRLELSESGPNALLLRFEAFYRRALSLGNTPIFEESGAVSDTFRELYDAIADARLYDVRYVKRPRSLRGKLVGNNHATVIDNLLNRSVTNLLSDGRGNERHKSLLFLLLRQALMVRIRFAALNILETEQMLNAEARARAGSADEFMVRSLLSTYHLTKWNYLLGDLVKIDGRFSIDFPTGSNSLFTYLTDRTTAHNMADYLAGRGDNALFNGFPQRARHSEEVAALQTHAADAARLKTIPKTRLEQLMHEHIDLCSHRLDAWQLGLANRRLTENRAQAGTKSGLYLGAYGWVENLRRGGERQLAEDLPPALHVDGEEPVYSDADNQGFIHCPSLNQAVTAAVLRSGYLTEADDTDIDNRMAVNLGSHRVRLALSLLDGVQSGQDLGALLGYRFERELHEAYQRYGISFDALIYDFRRAFPGVGAVDPASLSTERNLRVVTDGLALLDTVNDWIEDNVNLDRRRDRTVLEILQDGGSYSGQPWGLPIIGNAYRDGVLSAIDALADALDALGDLALAEGVFQIVRGNFPRAAAVLSALSEGRAMPTPQVVETPRSGTTVTHRLLLPLNGVDGRSISSALVTDDAILAANRSAALPAAWNHLPMTPRANAEPGINHWIAELMGSPTLILCICRATDGSAQVVSADSLALQPIDWLAMLGGGLEEAEAELSARLLQQLLPADADLGNALDNGYSTPQVKFAERDPLWPAEVKTLYEIGALLCEAAALLGKTRPVDADDLGIEEGSVDDGSADQPGWDLDEADARINESRQRLHTLTLALMTILNGDTAPTDSPEAIDPRAWVEEHAALLPDADNLLKQSSILAALLLQAAGFGIRLALPPLDFDSREAVATTLGNSLKNAFIHCAQRLQRVAAISSDGIGKRIEIAEGLFGKGFRFTPAFLPREPAQLRNQLTSDTLLRHGGPFAMDGFLAGAASVRDNVDRLQQVWALGQAFGATQPPVKPAQLPESANDYWLGIAFPPDHNPDGDKLSLAVVEPDAWDLTNSVRALLIDNWTETIPAREETTAVSFFYDQPDATPPQAILLAVSPRPGGNWHWDDLVHTLHDTLEIARNRTVEPEHLDNTLYSQLLPAIHGELVPNLVDDDTQELTGSRAILDFGANN